MDRQSELYRLQDEVKRLQIECKSKGDYIRELKGDVKKTKERYESDIQTLRREKREKSILIEDLIEEVNKYKKLTKALCTFIEQSIYV